MEYFEGENYPIERFMIERFHPNGVLWVIIHPLMEVTRKICGLLHCEEEEILIPSRNVGLPADPTE